MLSRSLSDINGQLLQSVVFERWSESQTIDFKQGLPGTDERSKQEFAKDVCAFANSDGGDLVFGIRDEGGQATELLPIDSTAHPVDATRRRLGQLLEANLEPRVEGVSIHPVVLENDQYVLVVRVPESFRKPHRSRAQNDNWRWPVRAGTHTAEFAYDQIRDAFDRHATLADRARQFRDTRLMGVLSGTTGRPLQTGPKCIVHLIPLAAVAGKATVDVRHLYNDYQTFMFGDWGGASRTLNLDGLVVHPGGNRDSLAHIQIFRNGQFESARFVGSIRADEARRNTVALLSVTDVVRNSLSKFLDACRRCNITGPAIASAALLDLSGQRIWYQAPNHYERELTADRPNLVLPEVWIEQLSDFGDVDSVARPLLDTLWQSFDLESCALYDDRGRWLRR